jgi:uncharacterized protein YxjI
MSVEGVELKKADAFCLEDLNGRTFSYVNMFLVTTR